MIMMFSSSPLYTGERDMYLSKDFPDIGLSVTPMDPVIKVWDLKTKTLTKQYRHEGYFFTSLLMVDDHRVLAWESVKKKLVLVDIVNEAVVWESKESIATRCAPSLYANCWVYFKKQNELVTFEEESSDLMVIDLETGMSLVKIILESFSNNHILQFVLHFIINAKLRGLIIEYFVCIIPLSIFRVYKSPSLRSDVF